MKRFAALGAAVAVTLLAGCATGDGYYSSGYGYDGYGYDGYGYGGYPAYAYNDYGYVPYYDDYGYPYAYGPTLGLGFGFYDYGGYRGGYRGDRRFGGGIARNGGGGFGGRPSSPPPGGLGPQAVGPQGAPSGTAVAPSGGNGRSGFTGRRRSF